jgi:hypothetical protein
VLLASLSGQRLSRLHQLKPPFHSAQELIDGYRAELEQAGGRSPARRQA